MKLETNTKFTAKVEKKKLPQKYRMINEEVPKVYSRKLIFEVFIELHKGLTVDESRVIRVLNKFKTKVKY